MKTQIILVLSCLTLQAFSAKSKYNEDGEDNPYEFGFTIDGQQHRHEKKDANGIIQGEFGFITADGIYHVTVYATDENGNFKILSMRNVRVSGPLDEPNAKLPDTSQFGKDSPKPVPNPLAIAPPAPTPPPISAVQTTPQRPYAEFTTQATIKPACAGCGYVTTPKNDGKPGRLPFQTPAFQNPKPGTVVIGNQPGNAQNDAPFNTGNLQGSVASILPQQPQIPNTPENSLPSALPQIPSQQGGNGFPSRFPQTPSQQGGLPSKFPQIPSQQGGFPSKIPQIPSQQGGAPSKFPQIPSQQGSLPLPQIPNQQDENSFPQTLPQSPSIPSISQPGSFPRPPVPNPLGIGNGNNVDIPNGITVDKNVIKVPNNDPIPIQDKYPGMVDGLPPGITKDDITDLLYKFNYTVGFHGHYEKGYKNGAKVGGYFVNDRDGVSRIVTYVADENGYRPKVKFIRLDLNSDLVPKEGSEKKFGLKNFEFVWYPLK